jgi:hypothetical protein
MAIQISKITNDPNNPGAVLAEPKDLKPGAVSGNIKSRLQILTCDDLLDFENGYFSTDSFKLTVPEGWNTIGFYLVRKDKTLTGHEGTVVFCPQYGNATELHFAHFQPYESRGTKLKKGSYTLNVVGYVSP